MRTHSPLHLNNCPRCPALGTQAIPGDEFYEILSLRFNIRIAREVCQGHVPHLVNRHPLGAVARACAYRLGARRSSSYLAWPRHHGDLTQRMRDADD